jgi:hypothetical protein
MEERATTSWLLLVTPLVALATLWVSSQGLQDLLRLSSWGVWVYWASGLLIGWLMFRRSKSVRDQEWHRSRSIKKLDKTYRSEDKGLWLQADAAGEKLAEKAQEGLAKKAQMRMDGTVQDLNKEAAPTEIESSESDIDTVKLFMDEEHVSRSQSRLSGETGPVESVVGVTESVESQDGIFGKAMGRIKQAREDAVSRAVTKQRGGPAAQSQTSLVGSFRSNVESGIVSGGTVGAAANEGSRFSAGQSSAQDTAGSRPSDTDLGSGAGVIHVMPGQDYDPSPSNIGGLDTGMNPAGVGVTASPEAAAASKRCSDCGAAMAMEEAYCPRCGAFAS